MGESNGDIRLAARHLELPWLFLVARYQFPGSWSLESQNIHPDGFQEMLFEGLFDNGSFPGYLGHLFEPD